MKLMLCCGFVLFACSVAHAEPCDTSLVKITAGPYTPHAESSVDIQKDGGQAFYDASTGTVRAKTVWPGMYSNIVNMKEACRLVGPESAVPVPVVASLHVTGFSLGQCAPSSNCEPGYASMGLVGATSSGNTNVVHGWQVGQNIDRTTSFNVSFLPGEWFRMDINLQTGVMGPPGSITVQTAQASFVLPEGYTIETCEGATVTPPPPGTVDVPAPRRGTLVLRALGANPARTLPAFACELPSAGAASLALVDLAGRVVLSRDLGWLPAGPHRVEFAGRAPAGVYWARLTVAGATTRLRVILL